MALRPNGDQSEFKGEVKGKAFSQFQDTHMRHGQHIPFPKCMRKREGPCFSESLPNGQETTTKVDETPYIMTMNASYRYSLPERIGQKDPKRV